MAELAILGGKPVRNRPFFSPVIIDDIEKAYVEKVLEAGELSRFMGSPSKNIKRMLEMPSREAERYEDQHFSFLGGRMIRKFEADFAKKFNVPYAVSVNSATSGLVTALGAIGAGPGDEVITTALSFNATALSILAFNSVPVFVDVNDKNFCLDPKSVEKAITDKTKAILVVHLLGNAADMDAIMDIAKRRNLKVIEDCAQSPGTRYKEKYAGTIGDIGVFSFQETKNITTGEGGMAITSDPALAKRMRLIRNHGESVPDDSWSCDEVVNIVGMNYRMTELTAAIGIAQLGKLSENNRIRTDNAAFLAKGLNGLPGISIPGFSKGAIPHIFAVIYDEEKTGVGRDEVLAALRAEGIPAGSGYVRTMYNNPVFIKKAAYGEQGCPWSCHLYKKARTYAMGDCPVAEELIAKKFIWFYHINRPNGISDMEDVLKAFKKVIENKEELKKIDSDITVGYKW